MSWQYRIVKNKDEYYIHSVIIENGEIIAISFEPATPNGKTFEELRSDLRRMMVDAFGKPILDWDDKNLFGKWDQIDCGYDTDDGLDTQDHLWTNREIYDSH